MRKYKTIYKRLSVWLIFLILISCISPVSFAETAISQQLLAGTKTAKANEVVDVPIVLSSNGNVAAAQFQFVYDTQALELTEVKKGTGLDSSFQIFSNLSNGKAIVGNISGKTITKGETEILLASFKIQFNATPKDYLIELQNVAFSSEDANDLTNQFSVANGKITVQTNLPAAPNVSADDVNDKIIGIDSTMEYQIDEGAWITYSTSNSPVLSGNHTVKVRVKASGSVPASLEKILTFLPTNGGGGGGSTTPSPSPSTENITVDVDGGNGNNLTQTPITRKTETDGTVKDTVTMTDNIAKDTVEKAKEQGIDTARIVIPDATDKVAEIRVDIPKTALSELNNGKINLEISTDNVLISIPTPSLANVTDDLYFRVVPIKTEPERQQVEERANNEQVVQAVAKGLNVQVLGRPMTIETNMSHHPVDLVLPLKGVTIPEQADQREAFFNKLGVFIEHSDGEKVFMKGEVVPYKEGELGLKFTITKFSTFTIVRIPDSVPTAKNVKITGSLKAGSVLKSDYQYKDADSDLEGKSLFKWYRADNAAGKNKKVITGAIKSTYKATSADKGKYISLEVTPVAKTGERTGIAVKSKYVGPILANTVSVKNHAPIATHLKITGKAIIGKTLKATYTFKDADKDKQGKSRIQWYQIDPKTNKKTAIKGATNTTYKVSSKDEGKKIVFEVKPVAKTGVKTGTKGISKKTAVINVDYKGNFKLGAIKNKAYAERLATILEKTYKAKNVTLKKDGVYYRISADFVDKKQANKVGKDMIKKNLIVDYYITSR